MQRRTRGRKGRNIVDPEASDAMYVDEKDILVDLDEAWDAPDTLPENEGLWQR